MAKRRRRPRQILKAGLANYIADLRAISRDIRLVLWSGFLIFFPFYVMPSGMPQPADLLLLILLPILLAGRRGRIPNDMMRPFRALVAFVLYVILVNLAWSFVIVTFSFNGKDGFLISPMFYLYNALMFYTFLLMFQRYGERMLWVTVRIVMLSVMIQILMSILVRGHEARSKLMFNDPNQLGYYALLCACIILVLQRRLKLSTIFVIGGVLACSYLSLISASKAALGSIVMLAIALLLSRIRTILIAAVVLGILMLTSNPFSDAIDHAQERITKDKSYGVLEERGYDRLGRYPQYLVLGAGEGAYRRFIEDSAIGMHELHSSMATVLFSYGVIGTSLFMTFLVGIMWRSGIRTWMVVGPGFAFGMTHQGLRFTLLWVLLGAAVALRHLDRAKPKPKLPASKPKPKPHRLGTGVVPVAS